MSSNFDGTSAEQFAYTVQVSGDTIDKAIVKRTQLKSRKGVMAIKNFDGLTGQTRDPVTNNLRTPLSQPSLDIDGKVTFSGTTSNMHNELNQKTLDDQAGADSRTSSDRDIQTTSEPPGQSVILEKHPGISKPRYILPTIAPPISRLTEEGIRPSLQHVPGSFRSEVAPTNDIRPTTVAPRGKGWGSIIQDIESWISLHDTASKSPRQGAHNPVKSNEDQNTSMTIPLIRHVRSQPSIRERESESTLQTTTSVESLCDLLPEAVAERLVAGDPAQPVLVTNINHEHPHRDEGSHSQIIAHPQMSNSVASSTVPSTKASMPNAIPPRSSSEHFNKIDLGDRHAVECVGDNPWLKERKVNHPQNRVLEDLNDASRQLSHRRSQFGTFKPKSVRRVSTVYQRRRSNSDSDANSTLSQKLSVSSKAFSNLSEAPLCSNVGSPMMHSMNRYDTDHSRHKDGHVKKSFSSPSSVSSQTTNKTIDLPPLTTKPQLLSRSPHQRSTSESPNTEANQPQSKRQWVRQLLGAIPVSSGKSDMSSLTTRPIRRQLSKTANGSLEHGLSPSGSIDSHYISQQQENAESFSKIILDLEDLLKEALMIAEQGADKDEENVHLRQTFPILADEQTHSVGIEKEGDHVKNHIAITEPESISRQKGQTKKYRDATPYPAASAVQTRHTSIALTAIPVQSPSEHAKELVDLWGLPEIVPDLPPMMFKSPALPQSVPSAQESQDLSVSVKSVRASGSTIKGSESKDWALTSRRSRRQLGVHELLPVPRKPSLTQLPKREKNTFPLREYKPSSGAQSREAVHEYIGTHHAPPVQPRTSSAGLQSYKLSESDLDSSESEETYLSEEDYSSGDGHRDYINITDYDMPALRKSTVTSNWVGGEQRTYPRLGPGALPKQDTIAPVQDLSSSSRQPVSQQEMPERPGQSLRGRRHFSIRSPKHFSLSRSHRRAPIARDWSLQRKRYVATVACINTALLGLIVGIYAGEVPAIQYALADEHHYTILGNVVFYLGLAIPTALFWPLPLLHGRKPYTLAALTLLLTLQFPQAMIVDASRSPYVANYRAGVLLSRTFAGLAIGFANINFQTTLLDLFGSSLQSKTPHQETVNPNDVRRHGGGMGLWLGVWTWCFIGSISVGFLIGAAIINSLNVSWGFWITIVLTAVVLVLNVMTPEVRRSSYRRSVAEVKHGSTFSRRIARGEVKMHLYQTGPKNWVEEVVAGNVLCFRMLKQPGFLVLALYMGWVYGQIIMVMVVSDYNSDTGDSVNRL